MIAFYVMIEQRQNRMGDWIHRCSLDLGMAFEYRARFVKVALWHTMFFGHPQSRFTASIAIGFITGFFIVSQPIVELHLSWSYTIANLPMVFDFYIFFSFPTLWASLTPLCVNRKLHHYWKFQDLSLRHITVSIKSSIIAGMFIVPFLNSSKFLTFNLVHLTVFIASFLVSWVLLRGRSHRCFTFFTSLVSP